MNSCCTLDMAECLRRRETYVQSLHGLDILLRGLGGITAWIIKLVPNEELVCSVGVAPPAIRRYLLNKLGVNLSAADWLHHCQMLEVVVRLEESVSSEEFDEDAPYAPNIAGKAPSKLQDDLGSTVMTGRHHG